MQSVSVSIPRPVRSRSIHYRQTLTISFLSILCWFSVCDRSFAAAGTDNCDVSTFSCAATECTINASYTFDGWGCVLDFGGRNVTINGNLRDADQYGEGSLTIVTTGNLTVRGTLTGLYYGVGLFVGGNILVEQQSSTRKGNIRADGGVVYINAEKDITLKGALVSAQAAEGEVSIVSTHGSIEVSTEIQASGDDYQGNPVSIVASEGSVKLSGSIKADGDYNYEGGEIYILAGKGDAVVSAAISANGKTNNGGTVTISAPEGSLTVSGAIKANGSGDGDYSAGGTISFDVGPDGKLAIEKSATVEAITTDYFGENGTVTFGPACRLLIDGQITVAGDGVDGDITVGYRNQFYLNGVISRGEGDYGQTVINCRENPEIPESCFFNAAATALSSKVQPDFTISPITLATCNLPEEPVDTPTPDPGEGPQYTPTGPNCDDLDHCTMDYRNSAGVCQNILRDIAISQDYAPCNVWNSFDKISLERSGNFDILCPKKCGSQVEAARKKLVVLAKKFADANTAKNCRKAKALYGAVKSYRSYVGKTGFAKKLAPRPLLLDYLKTQAEQSFAKATVIKEGLCR